tara:strand:+ start:77 stop:337 length:261 start_codon:yes stop_codon:yes gene_type:complete
MLKPSLTNFSDFIEKPKPVIPKSKYEIQQDINWSLNIIVILIVIIGFICLYYRFKYKGQHEKETKEKLKQFDEYLNEYYINDMLQK